MTEPLKLAVVGHTNVGKTSLLETLAGLRRGDGEIRWQPDDAQPHWLGHRNGLNLQLSAIDNLRFWCGINDAPPSGIACNAFKQRFSRHCWSSV